jgi:hypothetical protein
VGPPFAIAGYRKTRRSSAPELCQELQVRSRAERRYCVKVLSSRAAAMIVARPVASIDAIRPLECNEPIRS